MNTLLQMIAGTPWFVGMLFFYLVSKGITSIRAQTTKFWKLLIFPFLFFCLSLYSLIAHLSPSFIAFTAWGIALFIGIIINFQKSLNIPLIIDRNNRTIHMPGSWLPLFIILSIFFIKYYYNYQMAIHPHIKDAMTFALAYASLSGLFAGFIVGKVAGFSYRFYKAS